jgi:hypothetical protein
VYSKSTQTNKKPKVKTKVLLSLPSLKKRLQLLVNKYVRLRDEKDPCISCQKWSQMWDAGHYINQGSSGFLRFDPKNIHKQCRACNLFKRGNLLEYRINLVRKIGRDAVETLESKRHEVKHWTRNELEELVIYFKQAVKNQERINQLQPAGDYPKFMLSEPVQSIQEEDV